jgi:hypothetical protein
MKNNIVISLLVLISLSACDKNNIIALLPTYITPNSGYEEDIILIHGEDFTSGLGVILGTDSIQCTLVNENTLTFVIPELDAGIYPVQFFSNSVDFEPLENVTFTIPELTITGISPTTIKRGDILKISVENRNTNKSCDYVWIGDESAEFIEANSSYVRVRVSSDSILTDSPLITLKNGTQETTYQSNLQTEESWEQLLEDDDFNLCDALIAYPNGIPVMVCYEYPEYTKGLYQYDASSNTWDEIATNNTIGNYYEIMYKDEMVYIVSTYEDENENKYIKILSYSMDSEEWTEEGQFFYDEKLYHLISFLKDDKIYVGNIYFMTAFDIDSKKWEDKSVFPPEINPTYEGITSAPNDIVSFVLNNRCFVCASYYHYMGTGATEISEYNIDTDSWDYLSICPFYYDSNNGSTLCKNGELVYCCSRENRGSLIQSWVLNTTNNTWEEYYAPIGRGTESYSFILNGFVYYSHGEIYNIWYEPHVTGQTLSRINITDLFMLEQ